MVFYGAFGRRNPPVFSVFSVFRGPGPGGSDQVGGGHVNEKSSWDGPGNDGLWSLGRTVRRMYISANHRRFRPS